MLNRFARLFVSLLVWIVPAVGGVAAPVNCDKPLSERSRLGVVLMHGKQGTPTGPIGALVRAMRDAGYLVEAPEMPWSQRRFLDASLYAAFEEVNASVRHLKTRGARRLVIGGHSLGATAALAYTVRHRNVAGLIMLATGASPERMNAYMPGIADSVAKARRLVAAGRSKEVTEFAEFNRHRLTVRMTPEAYLSYLDPGGPALVPRNAARLPRTTPLLFVEGKRDPLHRRSTPAWAFNRAPRNPKSAYLVLPGGHLDVPREAIPAVLDWLACL